MYAWHTWTCTYSLNYDIEGDQGFMTAVLYDSTMVLVSPVPSWFVVDSVTISDAVIVTFSQPTQPLSGTYDTYYIDVQLWD